MGHTSSLRVSQHFFLFGVTRLIQVISLQWSGFIDSLPALSDSVLNKVGEMEARLKEHLGIEINLGSYLSINQWLTQIRSWALTHIPAILGNLASAALLVPVFSFFLLKDGDTFMRLYLQLIPKRFSRTAISVIGKITTALGTFLRAKLLEAALFGLMTYLGMIVLKAPYPGLFALIGGLLNFIPYLGPILGAAPPADLRLFLNPSASVLAGSDPASDRKPDRQLPDLPCFCCEDCQPDSSHAPAFGGRRTRNLRRRGNAGGCSVGIHFQDHLS